MSRNHCKVILIACACICNQAIGQIKKPSSSKNKLFQYSFMNALKQGIFASDNFTVRTVKEHGDFGIGIANNANGEMVMYDGQFYQALVSGEVIKVSDTLHMPLVFTTFFSADTSFLVDKPVSLDAVYQRIQKCTQGNQVYAIKITGSFDTLNVRTVPGQQRPFPLFADVVKQQKIFHCENISGTMVGFYTPDYLPQFNLPGFHFHFISKDLKKAGHLLNGFVNHVTVEIAKMRSIEMQVPQMDDFNGKKY